MSPDSAWVRWPLDSVAIRLPPEFKPATARLAERRRWQSPDSTAIELWFSEKPVLAVGGSSVAQFGGEAACRLTIGGRSPAIVVRYWVLYTGHPDTMYNAATTALISPGYAVDVAVNARSRAVRQRLLGALADLEMPAPPARATGQ